MKKFTSGLLALVLCGTIALTGCSTAWVSTLDTILAAAAPALINILNIIAIAEGKPVNANLEAKINADSTTIQSLAQSFASASAAAAPTVCAQLQAAITTYSADEQQVMALAQISDPATQSKVAVLSGLVAGTVVSIEAAIPNCKTTANLKKMRVAVPMPVKSFIRNYNSVLVTPTGNPGIDAWTPKHKLHQHNWLLRKVSLGHLA